MHAADGQTGDESVGGTDVDAPFTPVYARSKTGPEVLAAADKHSSPNRLRLRDSAFEKVASQARCMQERVTRVQGKIVLDVGDPVR